MKLKGRGKRERDEKRQYLKEYVFSMDDDFTYARMLGSKKKQQSTRTNSYADRAHTSLYSSNRYKLVLTEGWGADLKETKRGEGEGR